MNSATVIQELQELYPGKLIKCLPENNPSEIVCEFDTKDQHPEWSLAVAVIDRSAPHYHRVMTEIYHVIRGTLTLHVDDEEFVMYEGQQYTVLPGKVHWAAGDETWVEVHCAPGYTPDDHFLA